MEAGLINVVKEFGAIGVLCLITGYLILKTLPESMKRWSDTVQKMTDDFREDVGKANEARQKEMSMLSDSHRTDREAWQTELTKDREVHRDELATERKQCHDDHEKIMQQIQEGQGDHERIMQAINDGFNQKRK